MRAVPCRPVVQIPSSRAEPDPARVARGEPRDHIDGVPVYGWGQAPLAVMATDPQRTWRTTELATLLRLDRKSLSGSLNQWARRTILTKSVHGTFKIPDGPPVPSRLAVRLDDVVAVMGTDPQRHWHTRDIAAALNTVKQDTLAIHMSAWAKKKLLVKPAPATYALPPPQTLGELTVQDKPAPISRNKTRSPARPDQPPSRAA